MGDSGVLRCCSFTEKPYIWIHPGDEFNGEIMPGRQWYEMPCWISDDMALDLNTLEAHMFERMHLRAEMDDLLERASYGNLQQDPEFVKATRDGVVSG